jgi:hypothetical protein
MTRLHIDLPFWFVPGLTELSDCRFIGRKLATALPTDSSLASIALGAAAKGLFPSGWSPGLSSSAGRPDRLFAQTGHDPLDLRQRVRVKGF